MGISIGLVGLGQFGQVFADLFCCHPGVDRVLLCDREADRMRAVAARPGFTSKFNPRDEFTSYTDLLKQDIDSVAIITQPWLHAPQCLQALEAGKHVYSAVPVISLPDGNETLEWCQRLVSACARTGQYYMLGETTYFRPETMFCRRKAADGAFGEFIYAEGEYFHDVDNHGCNLREVMRRRLDSQAGAEWTKVQNKYSAAGFRDGPMHYPTHSVCGPVSVMHARAISVTAHGYRNRNHDPFFEHDAFSNEVALFRMSNGSTVRICEFRELAGSLHADETFRIIGTRGTFNERAWKTNHRTEPLTAKPLEVSTLTEKDMRDPLPPEVALAFRRIAEPDAREAGDFVLGGHGGSHPYLVHEFVEAVTQQRQPAIHVWEAAAYMAMGIAAHQSALRDGETLAVPDFGDTPKR